MQQYIKYIFRNVWILFLLIKLLSAERMRLEDTLRNSSKYGNKTKNTDNGENDFKREVMKTLEQCSSNKSQYNSDNDRYNAQSEETNGRYNQNGNIQWNKNKRGFSSNDHNRNYQNAHSDSNDRNDNYNGFNSNNHGQFNDNVENGQDCDPSDGTGDTSNYGYPNGFPSYSGGYLNNQRSGYGKNSKNCQSSFNNYNSNYGNGESQNDRNGDYNYGYKDGVYPYGQRTRRSDKNNNRYYANECTSQCVFGNMQLLDDDHMPSETLVLKWVEDNIENDDMKRITTFRELRKCFARLSTSDFDDGCEY